MSKSTSPNPAAAKQAAAAAAVNKALGFLSGYVLSSISVAS